MRCIRRPNLRLLEIVLILALPGMVQISGLACAADLIQSGLAPEVNRTQHDREIPLDVPKIKVDVTLATTDVTVIGNAASELNAEDFLIYDNGVLQKINHFSRDVLPLAVVVLIDRSSSIEPYLSSLEEAAISALKHLKPQDKVALLAFDDDLLKLSELIEDHNQISRILGKLTIGSATNIYDAISAAADYLRVNAPSSRRAIIMLSDNCHTVSQGNRERALTEVLGASATFYSIKTPGMEYAEEMRERDPLSYDSITMVKRIAAETGGEVLDVSASRSLQAALEKATSNLRLQYTLGFSPSNLGEAGSFHKLTVKLAPEERCPGCQLLTRSGYFTAVRAPKPTEGHATLIPRESDEKHDPYRIQRRIVSAGSIDADLQEVSFSVKTAGQKAAEGSPQLRMDFQINFDRVGFKTVENQRTCRLYVTVFYLDKKKIILSSQWRTLEGQLREETYNKIMREGLSVSIAVPQKDKDQVLRVVIYDEGSNSFGSKLVR